MYKKIKTKTKKLIQKIINNKIKSSIIFIVSIIFISFIVNGNDNGVYITETPLVDNLEQIVSVSGTVEANKKIELRFQSSGKIENINFSVGDKINEYDVISELDNDLQENSVQSALAQLNMAKADLNLVNAGPTEEEIKLALIRIEEAELNHENAKNNYEKILISNEEKIKKAELELDTAKEAFEMAGFDLESTKESLENQENTYKINLDNAYKDAENKINEIIIKSINSTEIVNDYNNIKHILNLTDTFFKHWFGDDYIKKMNIEDDLDDLQFKFNQLKIDYNSYQLEQVKEDFYTILIQIKKNNRYLLDVSNLIRDMIITSQNEDGEINNSFLLTYKTSLDAEISTISSTLTTITSLIEAIDLAEINYQDSILTVDTGINSADLDYITLRNNLDIAKSNLQDLIAQNEISANNAKLELDLKEVYLRQANTNYDQLIAEPRYVDVASFKSKVSQYNSSYERALIQLDDTKLYAPSGGIITNIKMDVGENVSSTENVVTIINDEFQILANISETEIAKIKIDDPVRLTLDAFSIDQEYTGKVIRIDPAETVIQGVIYYQTTILFDEYDEAIKPGMTVNLEIITDAIDETLQIPIQALNYDDDKVYVYILEGDEKIRQFIKTGIEGDYNIEVLEGLSLNDNIIIYEKT